MRDQDTNSKYHWRIVDAPVLTREEQQAVERYHSDLEALREELQEAFYCKYVIGRVSTETV